MNKPNQALEEERAFTTRRYARCSSSGVLRTQQGFTLIELMVVVAVIGVLAALAVYSFGRTQKNTKARAEVSEMFGIMKVKQEQAMLELGDYQNCGPTNVESEFFPAALAGNGNQVDITGGLPSQWTDLGIRPSTGGLLCQYVCVHGDAGVPAVGGVATTQFAYASPAADPWYYLIAQCDMDSNTGVNSFYFTHSGDKGLAFINQGN